jgi:hypothetical protein
MENHQITSNGSIMMTRAKNLGVTKSILATNSHKQHGIMKFTAIALLTFVGVASAGKPQLSVRKMAWTLSCCRLE